MMTLNYINIHMTQKLMDIIQFILIYTKKCCEVDVFYITTMSTISLRYLIYKHLSIQ